MSTDHQDQNAVPPAAEREAGQAADVPPPVPAVAALAAAVTAAERAKAGEPETGDAAAPRAPDAGDTARRDGAALLLRRHGLKAAALVLAAGLGWLGGAQTASRATGAAVPAPREPPPALVLDWATTSPFHLPLSQADLRRLAREVHAIAGGLVSVKAALETTRQDSASRLGQIGERLARSERTEAETGNRLAQATDRLAQLERAGREPAAALAAIAARLERIEARMAAAAAPASPPAVQAAAPSAPATTGSIPDAKAAAKGRDRPEREEVVEGWYLRSVHRGAALIEGRRGLLEVRPGQTVPGAGRVEAIERRGREWVVITSRGVIASEQW